MYYTAVQILPREGAILGDMRWHNVTYIRVEKCGIGCAKTAEPIELPLGIVSGMGPGNRALDRRAHWRHLANTDERLCTVAMSGSVTKGGDAAFSQITLGSLVAVL